MMRKQNAQNRFLCWLTMMLIFFVVVVLCGIEMSALQKVVVVSWHSKRRRPQELDLEGIEH
jgi:hypothetical protein